MSENFKRAVPLFSALALSTVVVATAFNPVPHSGGDNAAYIALAYDLLANRSYTDVFDPAGLPHTKYPPVFPLLLAGLVALGARSWVVLKLVAAVSTVAAVGFTYDFVQRRFDRLTAFAVAALVALASAVVYYSHWILSDPLFLALTIGSLAALGRAAVQEPDASSWLWIGVVSALLAFFTRSAGLPLVLAILGWLALDRRWRDLVIAAAIVGIPALGWWWRARGVAVASYAEEFWMVDPYQPALGTIGVSGLIPRALSNAEAYVFTHGPGGIVGPGASWLPLLGIVLTLAALLGWLITARERVGPVELFFPAYAGLILLWPEVWAGDRFALPLYPVMLAYAAVTLHEIGRRVPEAMSGLLAGAAVLAILLPAGGHWLQRASESSECARHARQAGPWACYGPGVTSFVDAAGWMGEALPEGSVAFSRKPRHFFVLSGLRSRTFPFDESPDAHLALADELGVRYVLLDQWDALAGRYVGSAVRRQPGGFCFVRSFGSADARGAQLLGIRTPRARSSHTDPSGAAQIVPCPSEYLRAGGTEGYGSSSSSSWRIPLLERLGM